MQPEATAMSHAEEVSLRELISTFQLRRRAGSEAFRDGVRLCDMGAVDIISETERSFCAEVLDAALETVTVRVEDGSLTGTCSCDKGSSEICRHQVAAAHALWNRP